MHKIHNSSHEMHSGWSALWVRGGRTRKWLLLRILGVGKKPNSKRNAFQVNGNCQVVLLACANKSYSSTNKWKRGDGQGHGELFQRPQGWGAEHVCSLASLKQHAQAGWLQRSFLQIFPVCLEGTLRERQTFSKACSE